MNLKKFIRSIPNYPKKGILFRDITSLIEDSRAFSYALKKMHKISKKIKHNKIAGIESRGFIFASALAYLNKKPLVLIRKKNKLPGKKISQKFNLEYGTDTIEVHKSSLNKTKIAPEKTSVNDQDLLQGKYLLLQKGKKNYYLVIAE